MESILSHQITQFLQSQLALPAEAIALATKSREDAPHLWPMILWQYGLLTLDQLEQVFDWLETV